MNNNTYGGNQLGFLDMLNIASFCLGLMNLEQNLTQNDKQELEQELNTQLSSLLNEIHSHLQEQDEKIDAIMKHLGVEINDS